MARLIWSPRATQDLEDICEFIARGSEAYACVFAGQVVSLIESIPSFPRAGGVVPEYGQDTIRKRLFHNYRIIYRVHEDDIEVVSICHGAKLLPPSVPE